MKSKCVCDGDEMDWRKLVVVEDILIDGLVIS